MNVVYLSASAHLGGAERSLLDVLASVRAAEPAWSLHLVLPGGGPLAARAAALGVSTTTVPLAGALARLGDAAAGGPAGDGVGRLALGARMAGAVPATATYLRRLRAVLAARLRPGAPGVVHSNGAKMHVFSALAAPAHASVVWHVHDHVAERPVLARLLRGAARRCDGVLAISQSVADQAWAVCGDGVPVTTVYNAVDLGRFTPRGGAADLDTLAGLAPAPVGTVRVGLVATFARWKGHETFLRALARLPDGAPVRGYVVGGGLYATDGSQHTLDELRALARALGVADRVGFTGYVDEPAAVMRALDVVVHASTAPEPFGLVIAEAMACGRALIASEAGGAAELIEPGVTALAHRPGDVAGLAECIGRLVSDAGLRARLGAAGRTCAERRFDRARLAGEVGGVYRAVTGTAVAAGSVTAGAR